MKITHRCGHTVHYDTRVSGDVDLEALVEWVKEQEAQRCPACKREEKP